MAGVMVAAVVAVVLADWWLREMALGGSFETTDLAIRMELLSKGLQLRPLCGGVWCGCDGVAVCGVVVMVWRCVVWL